MKVVQVATYFYGLAEVEDGVKDTEMVINTLRCLAGDVSWSFQAVLTFPKMSQGSPKMLQVHRTFCYHEEMTWTVSFAQIKGPPFNMFNWTLCVNMSSAAKDSTQETENTSFILVCSWSAVSFVILWRLSHFGSQAILSSLRPLTMKPCTVSLRRWEGRVRYCTVCICDKNLVYYKCI